MPRRPKRLSLTPDQIKEGCHTLEAAHRFLAKVCEKYPIKFYPAEPYGAAGEAMNAIAAVGHALTVDPELFQSQRLSPEPPFHKR